MYKRIRLKTIEYIHLRNEIKEVNDIYSEKLDNYTRAIQVCNYFKEYGSDVDIEIERRLKDVDTELKVLEGEIDSKQSRLNNIRSDTGSLDSLKQVVESIAKELGIAASQLMKVLNCSDNALESLEMTGKLSIEDYTRLCQRFGMPDKSYNTYCF